MISELLFKNIAVSRVCFGQAYIGQYYSEQEAWRLLDIYLEHGGNFIDTARIYSDWVPGEKGRSERILGDYFLHSCKRDKFVISTKGGCQPDGMFSPSDLMKDLENSLAAMRTDHVEFYLFHRDIKKYPPEAFMELLELAKTQGKILEYGVSNWPLSRCSEALNAAASHHWTGIKVNQILLSPGVQYARAQSDPSIITWDADFADFHRKSKIPVMAFSSQAKGFFSRYLNPLTRETSRDNEFYSAENVEAACKMEHLSKRYGISLTNIIMQYLTRYPEIQVFPVFSVKSEAQLIDVMKSFEIPIPDHELASLVPYL